MVDRGGSGRRTELDLDAAAAAAVDAAREPSSEGDVPAETPPVTPNATVPPTNERLDAPRGTRDDLPPLFGRADKPTEPSELLGRGQRPTEPAALFGTKEASAQARKLLDFGDE